ncbi:MAG: secondary thiamine-phosphate synthase enzyme YjbQ [Solirubrobacterales bacterium]
MAIDTAELRFSTNGEAEILDITAAVNGAVEEAAVGKAQALVFVLGSTAAITTMEFEPGAVHDLREMFERLIPAKAEYEHNRLNHDTNSHAHQRASLVGASETLPVIDRRLALGTWQQLVLIDFDDRPRERSVVVSVLS